MNIARTDASDIILEVSDSKASQEFPTHRTVLTRTSRYFDRVLLQDSHRFNVTLPEGIGIDQFELYLRVEYGEARIDIDTIPELLPLYLFLEISLNNIRDIAHMWFNRYSQYTKYLLKLNTSSEVIRQIILMEDKQVASLMAMISYKTRPEFFDLILPYEV